MNRTERQKLAIRRWLDSNGIGTIVAATGFGKTYMTCMLIKALYNKNPKLSVLIGVPTEVLKEQWLRELAKNQLFSVCKVEIFNTIVKNQYTVDLFVIDEIHCACSENNINMFKAVKYRYFLGLTATFERLDGKEDRLSEFTYVCDRINIKEAVDNNWLSDYRNYKVLIDVDLSLYHEWNQKFQNLFSIFNFEFNTVMNCISRPGFASKYAKKTGWSESQVKGFAAAWIRMLRKRKSFVMSHPKKFEIADKILDARSNKKAITFSATIKDAEYFKKRGYVLHSKQKKKENNTIIESFNQQTVGVLSTSKSCDAGVDIKGLSVGIILSGDSSKTRTTQRIGRIIRFEEGKISEMFTLVIKGTIEETWYNNSNSNQQYITIDESQLDIVLSGKEISTRPKKGIIDIEHRF